MGSSAAGYSVVPVQKAFTALRIIQVIFGVIVLGLSAYLVSLTTSYGSSYVFTPGAIAIFTAIATGIFVVYWFVAHGASGKSLYNYWALFAVEVFLWIFWLTTFALYASWVTGVIGYTGGSHTNYPGTNTYCYAGYCVNIKRGLEKRYYSVDSASACIYAALALSVVNFLLFSATTVLFAINMFRHRTAQSQITPASGNKEAVELHQRV
ncbi:hypothetical protein B0J11DRAFT_504648 [Dendryphion nanum]|uniref:MARVEL domain-containing protein n=1 Tax=Dendryphion nanum TaxID=256645 RepID=A0A9P9IMP1_9PLEO|nr:hypothetical protein B0J11DRAFT_504648 [Dendryphion nanum]